MGALWTCEGGGGHRYAQQGDCASEDLEPVSGRYGPNSRSGIGGEFGPGSDLETGPGSDLEIGPGSDLEIGPKLGEI